MRDSGIIGHPGSQRRVRAPGRPQASGRRVPAAAGQRPTRDRSRGDPVGPVHRAGELGTARAHQARQADDLAGPQLEAIRRSRRARSGRGPRAPPVRPAPTGCLAGNVALRDRPSIDAQQRLLGLARGGRGAHQAAVAQDRHLDRRVRATSPRKCETSTTVVPPVASRRMTWCSRSASGRDRAAVGSSITISWALRHSARRISTFCWSAVRRPRPWQVAAELEARGGGELVVPAAERAPRRRSRPAAARCRGRRSPRPTARARSTAPARSGRSRGRWRPAGSGT